MANYSLIFFLLLLTSQTIFAKLTFSTVIEPQVKNYYVIDENSIDKTSATYGICHFHRLTSDVKCEIYRTYHSFNGTNSKFDFCNLNIPLSERNDGLMVTRIIPIDSESAFVFWEDTRLKQRMVIVKFKGCEINEVRMPNLLKDTYFVSPSFLKQDDKIVLLASDLSKKVHKIVIDADGNTIENLVLLNYLDVTSSLNKLVPLISSSSKNHEYLMLKTERMINVTAHRVAIMNDDGKSAFVFILIIRPIIIKNSLTVLGFKSNLFTGPYPIEYGSIISKKNRDKNKLIYSSAHGIVRFCSKRERKLFCYRLNSNDGGYSLVDKMTEILDDEVITDPAIHNLDDDRYLIAIGKCGDKRCLTQSDIYSIQLMKKEKYGEKFLEIPKPSCHTNEYSTVESKFFENDIGEICLSFVCLKNDPNFYFLPLAFNSKITCFTLEDFSSTNSKFMRLEK